MNKKNLILIITFIFIILSIMLSTEVKATNFSVSIGESFKNALNMGNGQISIYEIYYSSNIYEENNGKITKSSKITVSATQTGEKKGEYIKAEKWEFNISGEGIAQEKAYYILFQDSSAPYLVKILHEGSSWYIEGIYVADPMGAGEYRVGSPIGKQGPPSQTTDTAGVSSATGSDTVEGQIQSGNEGGESGANSQLPIDFYFERDVYSELKGLIVQYSQYAYKVQDGVLVEISSGVDVSEADTSVIRNAGWAGINKEPTHIEIKPGQKEKVYILLRGQEWAEDGNGAIKTYIAQGFTSAKNGQSWQKEAEYYEVIYEDGKFKIVTNAANEFKLVLQDQYGNNLFHGGKYKSVWNNEEFIADSQKKVALIPEMKISPGTGTMPICEIKFTIGGLLKENLIIQLQNTKDDVDLYHICEDSTCKHQNLYNGGNGEVNISPDMEITGFNYFSSNFEIYNIEDNKFMLILKFEKIESSTAKPQVKDGYIEIECKSKNFYEAIKEILNKQGDFYDEYLIIHAKKENVEKITSINLEGKRDIIDISGIKKFTNLTYLNLSHTGITDISELEDLQSIKELYLAYNEIEDIRALENMKSMQILDLSNNKINKIDALKYMEDMEHLDLSGNKKITNITALENMENMKYLSLILNEIQDISALGKMNKLEQLFLSQNKIDNISVLSDNTGLQTLWLEENRIADFSHIADLKENITNLRTEPQNLDFKVVVSENIINGLSNKSLYFSPYMQIANGKGEIRGTSDIIISLKNSTEVTGEINEINLTGFMKKDEKGEWDFRISDTSKMDTQKTYYMLCAYGENITFYLAEIKYKGTSWQITSIKHMEWGADYIIIGDDMVKFDEEGKPTLPGTEGKEENKKEENQKVDKKINLYVNNQYHGETTNFSQNFTLSRYFDMGDDYLELYENVKNFEYLSGNRTRSDIFRDRNLEYRFLMSKLQPFYKIEGLENVYILWDSEKDNIYLVDNDFTNFNLETSTKNKYDGDKYAYEYNKETGDLEVTFKVQKAKEQLSFTIDTATNIKYSFYVFEKVKVEKGENKPYNYDAITNKEILTGTLIQPIYKAKDKADAINLICFWQTKDGEKKPGTPSDETTGFINILKGQTKIIANNPPEGKDNIYMIIGVQGEKKYAVVEFVREEGKWKISSKKVAEWLDLEFKEESTAGADIWKITDITTEVKNEVTDGITINDSTKTITIGKIEIPKTAENKVLEHTIEKSTEDGTVILPELECDGGKIKDIAADGTITVTPDEGSTTVTLKEKATKNILIKWEYDETNKIWEITG